VVIWPPLLSKLVNLLASISWYMVLGVMIVGFLGYQLLLAILDCFLRIGDAWTRARLTHHRFDDD
jgi:uncharacterized membrane protein